MENLINIADYANLGNGFGVGSASDVADLSKALTAGYQMINQTGGSALRVESLEESLKVVTFTNKHIKLWKKIPKSPAYSTVEEYNVLGSYGESRSFGFTREGELPQEQSSNYSRQAAFVKYIGTTRSVSHPMTLVNPAHGDAIALENQNGILWMLEQIENTLYKGNAQLAFNRQSEQWDGLNSLIAPQNIVDLAGSPLQEADIEEASNIIVEQYGYPTDMYLGTRAKSDLIKTMYPRERVNLPAPAEGRVGMNIKSMSTGAGDIDLNETVFIKRAANPPVGATSPSAPDTPATVACGAGAANTADWAKLIGTPTGDTLFAYAVTACNRFGESAPRFMAAPFTLTAAQAIAGNAINVTTTNPAVIGAHPPEFYIVYRSNPLPVGAVTPGSIADYSEIARIPSDSQVGADTTVFADQNVILPFTEQAYLGEMTPSVLTFRQLAPLMKMDLAPMGPSYRWMVLMYGVMLLFAPAKWTRLINIGRLTSR